MSATSDRMLASKTTKPIVNSPRMEPIRARLHFLRCRAMTKKINAMRQKMIPIAPQTTMIAARPSAPGIPANTLERTPPAAATRPHNTIPSIPAMIMKIPAIVGFIVFGFIGGPIGGPIGGMAVGPYIGGGAVPGGALMEGGHDVSLLNRSGLAEGAPRPPHLFFPPPHSVPGGGMEQLAAERPWHKHWPKDIPKTIN